MRTIAITAVLADLSCRLEAVTPTQARVWGTMSAQQMLVHLGDGADAVLKRRPFTASPRQASRVVKWVALSLPLPWPRGIRSGAEPASRVLPAGAFSADRERAVRTLHELAAASEGALAPTLVATVVNGTSRG